MTLDIDGRVDEQDQLLAALLKIREGIVKILPKLRALGVSQMTHLDSPFGLVQRHLVESIANSLDWKMPLMQKTDFMDESALRVTLDWARAELCHVSTQLAMITCLPDGSEKDELIELHKQLLGLYCP